MKLCVAERQPCDDDDAHPTCLSLRVFMIGGSLTTHRVALKRTSANLMHTRARNQIDNGEDTKTDRLNREAGKKSG